MNHEMLCGLSMIFAWICVFCLGVGYMISDGTLKDWAKSAAMGFVIIVSVIICGALVIGGIDRIPVPEKHQTQAESPK